jgi:1,2-diacylglycerol 3-alpha-glucosyltransferase
MRILFVVDTYPPNVNGAALATQRIINELYKHGNEMYVVAPSTSLRNYVKKENGVTVYRIRSVMVQKTQEFRVSPQILFYRRELKKIIKEVEPDVLHINNPGFLGLATIPLSKEFNIPIVGTSHFMPENIVHYLHLPDVIEDLVNSIIWKRYAKWYSELDAVISPTETAANLLRKNNIKTKIYVLSNGIDMIRFKANKESGEHLKKKFNLPDVPTALFVGRLDKEKQIEVFLRAASEIKDKAKFHVVIVGKGKEYDDLVGLSKSLGIENIVTFTGYLSEEDLSKIYNVADIFVMPGIAELQSLVTMEAMATGIPVLAANAVALPHLVKDNKDGYLFRPGDSHDLANKLLKLITDTPLRQKLGEGSLKLIKVHDISEVIKNTEGIYQRLINQNARKLPVETTKKKGTVTAQVARIRHLASRIVG